MVIGDAHVRPGCNLDRFTWLMKRINEVKPTHIIQIGDFADMHSLSFYDKGKVGHEGRRYLADIDSLNEVLHFMEKESKKYKWTRENWFNIEKHTTLGNHEHRIIRATELCPELHGVIGFHDFQYPEYGWKMHGFLTPLKLQGVTYMHYLPNKMGKAVSGMHQANSMINTFGASITVGHSHLIDFKVRSYLHTRINALVCGSFLAKGQKEEYAGMTQELWWRGIVVKTNVHKGKYDPSFISY